MELFFLFCGILLSVAGIIGCVAPSIPGPPLNFVALLLLQASLVDPLSTELLVTFGVLAAAISVLDYYLPIWGVKRFGGTKYGIWGALIGMVVGIIFFPPFGMILGTLIGAIGGELIGGARQDTAIKAGMASFVITLILMTVKLIISVVMTFFFFERLFTVPIRV